MTSQATDVRSGAGWRRGGVRAEGWTAPDAGRRLQLVLAAIWLLAVLLWPPARDQLARHQVAPDQLARHQPAPFVAGRFTGVQVARVIWLVLWGGLAWLAVLPATRAPKAFGGMVAGMASGEPGWLARTDDQLGAFLTRHGPAAAVVLAIVLALVAVSVYLPRPAVRAGVVLGLVVAVFLWIAQGFGGMLAGDGTDPDSGPLLALVALAYWPLARAEGA